MNTFFSVWFSHICLIKRKITRQYLLEVNSLNYEYVQYKNEENIHYTLKI